MKKLQNHFKKFSIYFTLTFLLFCLVNAIALVVVLKTKRFTFFETIVLPQKLIDSNPVLMQQIHKGKSITTIQKLYSECPNNVSHPTLPFMMQPIQNENYTVGLENCRYDNFCKETNFYQNINDGVWVFGGSTTFGVGVSSNETFTSYLNQLDKNNHYFNFGVSGYHQSLEIDKLILLLKKGFRPKKVIFMDGLNDMSQLSFTNFNSNETPAKAHLAYATTFNPENELQSYNFLAQLPIVKLMLLKRRNHQNNFEDIYSSKVLYHQNPLLHYNKTVSNLPVIKDWSKKVYDYYQGNLTLIESLSKSYGFEYQVFFQPNGILYAKNNFVTNYTDFKKELINYNYVIKGYQLVQQNILNGNLKMIDVTNLDSQTEYPYVDLVHYTKEMNYILARKILSSK